MAYGKTRMVIAITSIIETKREVVRIVRQANASECVMYGRKDKGLYTLRLEMMWGDCRYEKLKYLISEYNRFDEEDQILITPKEV